MSVGAPTVPAGSSPGSILDIFDRVATTISNYKTDQLQRKLLAAGAIQEVEARRLETMYNTNPENQTLLSAGGGGALTKPANLLIMAGAALLGIVAYKRLA